MFVGEEKTRLRHTKGATTHKRRHPDPATARLCKSGTALHHVDVCRVPQPLRVGPVYLGAACLWCALATCLGFSRSTTRLSSTLRFRSTPPSSLPWRLILTIPIRRSKRPSCSTKYDFCSWRTSYWNSSTVKWPQQPEGERKKHQKICSRRKVVEKRTENEQRSYLHPSTSIKTGGETEWAGIFRVESPDFRNKCRKTNS